MNDTYEPKKTKHPGWPSNKSWQSFSQWEKDIEPRKEPAGQGLFGSDTGLPKEDCSPPHPEFVKKWRSQNNKTVKEAAKYFDLSEVQILEACR